MGARATPRRPATPVAASQRILVTGGSGFIGRHVVVVLPCAGNDVALVDRAAGADLLPVTAT